MPDAVETSERLSALFGEASTLAPAEREAFLLRACPDDTALRQEVLSLLHTADQVPEDFLSGGGGRPDGAPPCTRPAPPNLSGYRLRGRYTIDRMIGEGGMSVVYHGSQDHPQRRVAVKIMRSEFVSPKVLRRFEFEPDILARFDHPGIVRVLDADVEDFGCGDGPQPYFVMEYVEGVPLTEYVRRHDLSLRDRLKLFAIVCDAVQEAHQKGIIHRDLKPSNILVTAEGKPKLLDFGIAKVIDPTGGAGDPGAPPPTVLTEGFQLLGTLQYMSPEQCNISLGEPLACALADRQAGPLPAPSNPAPCADRTPSQTGLQSLDTRSDVYALGVLLYELLTGRRPYDVSNMTIISAARTICESTPTPPSPYERRLRGDLEAVILKAIEKDRARRYASASHLADDIRRYLAGDPTAARQPTWRTRALRWMRRHLILTTAATCALIGAISGLSTYFLVRTALNIPDSLLYIPTQKTARLISLGNKILWTWENVDIQGVDAERRLEPHSSLFCKVEGRDLIFLGFQPLRSELSGPYSEVSTGMNASIAGLRDADPTAPVHVRYAGEACAFDARGPYGQPLWHARIEDKDDFGKDPMGRDFFAEGWHVIGIWGCTTSSPKHSPPARKSSSSSAMVIIRRGAIGSTPRACPTRRRHSPAGRSTRCLWTAAAGAGWRGTRGTAGS